MEVKQKKLPKSQIELEFELTAEEFNEHFEHALEHLKRHVKVDGFRPGQAPAKMVEDKIKPEALLMEAGDHAVQHVYSDYVRQNNLEPVGHPEVQIKKIARGSEFIFTAIVTLLPEVKLPDYKEIAKSVKGKDISVTEEEVQDALNYLQKSRAKMSLKSDVAEKGDFVEIEYFSPQLVENKAAPQGGASLAPSGREVKDQFILGEAGFVKDFENGILGMKAGEEKEFNVNFPKDYHGKEVAGKEVSFKVKMISVQKMELPEINDEFAKQLGAFDSLTAMKASMKEGITAEKTEEEKQRRRAEILNKIAEKADLQMPQAMVDYEKERLLEDMKNKITQNMKLTFEQYLAAVKKTEEEIKNTFEKEAEKRLRGFLVLRELGKAEGVEIPDNEVEEEVNKALKGKTLQQAQGEIDINQFREYTKGVLFNEKVFQILEKCQ